MASEATNDRPDEAPQPRPRRRWLRRLAAVLLTILVVLLVAPYLLALPPLRSVVLGLAFKDLNGSVTAERTRLGWFSPPGFYGIKVAPPEGPPLLAIAAVEGDRPLWRMVAQPSNLGQFRIEHPQVDVVVTPTGSNAEEVLGPQFEQTAPQREVAVPNMSVGVRIENATFSFHDVGRQQPWLIGDMNFAARLQSSAAGAPDVVVEHSVLLDRTAISPDMCDDVLKYIAPVMAGVTRAQGAVSLEIDDGWLPLSDVEAGKMSGRLSIHQVQVGSGPLISVLAAFLGLPAEVDLANNSIVEFRLDEGRVYHEGLEFGLPNLPCGTSGSVGLDQTLDVVAAIDLPEFEIPTEESRPLLESLSGRTIELPIRGTLNRPMLAAGAAAGEEAALTSDLLSAILNGSDLLVDVLEQWRERRQERLNSGEPSGPILPRLLRDRPLRRLLREGNGSRPADPEQDSPEGGGAPSRGDSTPQGSAREV